MAIKKPGSRFTDRNRIRRMHEEGYSIDQIANAVSIVPEHVRYVIEEQPEAEERNKTEVARLQAQRDAEAQRKKIIVPANAPQPAAVDLEAIKAQVKAELLAEMQAASKPAKPEVAEAPPEEPAEEEEAADPPPKRRRRAAE